MKKEFQKICYEIVQYWSNSKLNKKQLNAIVFSAMKKTKKELDEINGKSKR